MVQSCWSRTQHCVQHLSKCCQCPALCSQIGLKILPDMLPLTEALVVDNRIQLISQLDDMSWKLIIPMGQPLFVAILSCAIFLWSRRIIVQMPMPNCTVLKSCPPSFQVMATYFWSATKRSLDTSDGILSLQYIPGHRFRKSSCVIVDTKEDCTSSSSSFLSSVRSCNHVRTLESHLIHI